MPKQGGMNLLTAVVQKVSTESALNPIIWIAAVILVLTFLSPKMGDPELTHYLMMFSGAIIALFIFCYIYFMFFNPNKLQSEKFQLTQQRNQLMLDERFRDKTGEVIDVTPTSNTHISSSEDRK